MFVQLGDNYAFNPDHIVDVLLWDDHAAITFDFSLTITQADGEAYIFELEGPDYEAFLDWWEHKAEVYKAG